MSDKTVDQIRQEILNALSANVTKSNDAGFPESVNVHAQTARTLAETYTLLGHQP